MGSLSTGDERADTRPHQTREKQAKMADDRRRALIRQYNDQNEQHKLDLIAKEKQDALRQNRETRFWRPEEVPNLPMPDELADLPPRFAPGQLRSKAPAGELKLLKWAGILLLLFVPAWIALLILATWPNLLSILLLLAVVVTEVWLTLRYLARGRA